MCMFHCNTPIPLAVLSILSFWSAYRRIAERNFAVRVRRSLLAIFVKHEFSRRIRRALLTELLKARKTALLSTMLQQQQHQHGQQLAVIPPSPSVAEPVQHARLDISVVESAATPVLSTVAVKSTPTSPRTPSPSKAAWRHAGKAPHRVSAVKPAPAPQTVSFQSAQAPSVAAAIQHRAARVAAAAPAPSRVVPPAASVKVVPTPYQPQFITGAASERKLIKTSPPSSRPASITTRPVRLQAGPIVLASAEQQSASPSLSPSSRRRVLVASSALHK